MPGLCEPVVALKVCNNFKWRSESSSVGGAGLRESHRQACEHVRKSHVSTFAPMSSIVLPFNVSRVEKIRFLRSPLIPPHFSGKLLDSIHDDHAQDDFLSELISRSVRMFGYAS
ncbi:PREDICTED: uncharacterized protein LOC105148641 [Acromyrmex echinatior]|uniref:uncharacterized protein LOC105148641 n=1 Tax=Acromyrmex echinatior TaxID=103372 RepID=UPI000580EEE2|nr:PREDICTED: uncharacterized protein LOC105148641 [Acromyrmex echinatior]